MRALPTDLRKQLEDAVLAGRHAAEAGVRAAFASLGVEKSSKPAHLDEEKARLRRALRAKRRQLGGDLEVLVWDAAYEQWHRLLFARFLAENRLLRHPEFDAPVTLEECEELAEELGEPDGWSVAARFAAEILPGIFRLDDPCLKLRLAPEHRAALERVVVGLPAEVFAADDSLGWVYQYWQSERKDQVNASEVKIGGADLGPVTQLFTENYMVRFLLENSLGAWWAARHPDSPLVNEYEYLRFDDDGQPAAGTFKGWPAAVADVTVMDPCCGSGHFLVEAFGMLWRMRAEEEGLDRVAAQDAVLRDNLFGLELDPRCVQIALFAVALAAWKQGDGYRRLPTPSIACSGIPAKAPLEEWTGLADGDARLERALERLHTVFRDADTLGSLIDPRRATEVDNAVGLQRSFDDVDFEEVAPLLEKAAVGETDDPATAVLGADAAGIARAAQLLSRTYTLSITNPPFLGSGRYTQRLTAATETLSNEWVPELSVSFMQRMFQLATKGGSLAAVLPQAWQYQKGYLNHRRELLHSDLLALIARLGTGAFTSISGEVVNVMLLIADSGPRSQSFAALDASDGLLEAKKYSLMHSPLTQEDHDKQLHNPDSRIVIGASSANLPLLEDVAECRWGMGAGDRNSFERFFWEVKELGESWEYLLTSGDGRQYSGRSSIVLWEKENGRMAALAESVKHRNHKAQQWRSGKPLWGRSGIAVNTVGRLKPVIYCGEMFGETCLVVVPEDPQLVPALWAFASTGHLESEIESLGRGLTISPRTVLHVPFDAERWRAVATEEYPEGLPEPWSDDPTQWLFEGRPDVATEPLQVGVGRLLGYRWPEQPETDELDEWSDSDGIVCLPPVGGELPAADRLTGLLAKAYGDQWSPAVVRQLLEHSGSSKKTLADWLRDDFFKDHCKVFDNRPFIWHITDGRKDGFSALVNYHRLDRAGLERLTYTYLGDWIERQRAAAADDAAGADLRLAAAQELKAKLELILEGEKPYDIYVRWKKLHEQPIGWEPDLDDGVRLNIRPFVKAGVLAGPPSVPRVHWKKDRGKNPDGSERHNDRHYTIAEKQQARQKARSV